MLVKKTLSGKFSFVLDYQSRDEVYTFFVSFLETESAKLILKQFYKHVNEHMLYSVAHELFNRIHSRLISPSKTERLIITRSEAIAFVWLMEGSCLIEVKDVRAALHKLLS